VSDIEQLKSSNTLDSLFQIDDESDSHKLTNELLSDSNIERKTELDKPIQWSIINVLENRLNTLGLLKSEGILKTFKESSFRYLISKARQGRKEYVEALKNIQFASQNQQNQQNNVRLG
jgi:hypothetical protein